MDFKCAISWIKKCMDNERNNFLYICLFGGEPLLQFPLVKQICEWTWKQEWHIPYSFLLQTNGTVLNDDMRNWFRINKDRICICLSIDGGRETHNKNRNNSFDSIDIGFFQSVWSNLPVKMTISKHNISAIKDDIVWLHEQGFEIRGSNFAVGEGSLKEEDFQIIREQLQLLSDYYIAHPTLNMAPILNIPLHLLVSYKSDKYINCRMGTNKLIVVNTDGSTSPCSYFSNISLSMTEDDNLQQQLKTIDIKKSKCYISCAFFPICNVCYAENYVETKDIYTPSWQRCKLMKICILAAMYTMANRIVKKKDVTYKDTLTIKTIKKYYQQLKTEVLYEEF